MLTPENDFTPNMHFCQNKDRIANSHTVCLLSCLSSCNLSSHISLLITFQNKSWTWRNWTGPPFRREMTWCLWNDLLLSPVTFPVFLNQQWPLTSLLFLLSLCCLFEKSWQKLRGADREGHFIVPGMKKEDGTFTYPRVCLNPALVSYYGQNLDVFMLLLFA